MCVSVTSLPRIRGAFHDNFPGLSGFGFRRKSARTKTQQGTEKSIKHNGSILFSRYLVFHMHQQKWIQLWFILYTLFILIPRHFLQITFSTSFSGRDTDAVTAIVIMCHFCRGVKRRCRRSRRHRIRYFRAGPLPLSDIPHQEMDTETSFGDNRCRSSNVVHHHKFLMPHLIYLIPHLIIYTILL